MISAFLINILASTQSVSVSLGRKIGFCSEGCCCSWNMKKKTLFIFLLQKTTTLALMYILCKGKTFCWATAVELEVSDIIWKLNIKAPIFYILIVLFKALISIRRYIYSFKHQKWYILYISLMLLLLLIGWLLWVTHGQAKHRAFWEHGWGWWQ